MPGILPNISAGGVVVPSAVTTNVYIPPAPFTFDCEQTALPNNCEARVTPSQINAIVSEIIGLAACFDPEFEWSCSSVTNLCAAFQAWVAGSAPDACAALTITADRLRSYRVFAGSANGQNLGVGGTSLIGAQGPSGAFSTVINNPDNCLPMHVVVSGDVNFQYSSNGAGGGSQQAIAFARVNAGAWSLLSSTSAIPAATITGGAIWPASSIRGFLTFDIAPLGNATVDFATELDTLGASVTRDAARTTVVGAHGWYDTSY